MRSTVPVALAVAMAGVCLMLAACGSPPTPSTLGPVALTVYRATVAAGSAQVNSSFSYDSSGRPDVTETGTGTFSWTSNLGELTYRASGAPGPAIVTTEIIDGHEVYQRTLLPPADSGTVGSPADDRWSETTWSGSPGTDLMETLVFGSPGPPNPGSLLQFLKTRASSISDQGRVRLGASETTHYLARLPLTQIAGGKVSPTELAQARQALGTTSLGVDFWVDSSERLRRLTFALTVRHLPTTPGTDSIQLFKLPLTVTDTLDVSDYGVPVAVSPPPAGDVTPGGTCQTNSGGFDCQSP
jgi:hypothetical protein